MLTDRRIGAILRENGHKLTPQRQAVIAAIAGNRDHVTPTEIHTRVRREHPRVGLVTVYRTLDLLSRLGLICEVHAGGTCRSYLLRRPKDDHHHHLICSRCGTVADFTDCDLGDLEGRLSLRTGFAIDSHLLEFSGTCRRCREEKPGYGGPAP